MSRCSTDTALLETIYPASPQGEDTHLKTIFKAGARWKHDSKNRGFGGTKCLGREISARVSGALPRVKS